MITVLLVVIAFILGMVVVVVAAGPLIRMLQPKQSESQVARWKNKMAILGALGYGDMTEDQKQWYYGIVTCLDGDRLHQKRLDRLNAADVKWIVETMQEMLTVCQRVRTDAETVKAAVQRVAAAQKQLTVAQERS